MKSLKFAAAACLALLLTACGAGLSGTYANDTATYEFHSDGTAEQTAMGIEVKLKYKLDGKKIEVESPNGTLIYELLEDGSIKTPFGVLKKQ
ncbi:hypothetical protein B0T49_20305 [Chromobacterium violaceum]|uniref:hypothetical protein n=1 Tax=Chromobacterium violaceum TaxID=536 RepID=UPI0009D9D0FF|nr:hypothetical protein [Chromobacterium violaceum]OQS45773.1 hypothetical protein B0T48_17950 [Chromobacterium violaceum]OQS46207.1 hypothetical protein B0T49_20305 [Chromobacterium violaceum]